MTSSDAVDDVRVGEDVALVVEHEAGAGRRVLAACAAKTSNGDCGLLDRARADEDDARRVALVDVARGQARSARGSRRGDAEAQRRLLDDRRRARRRRRRRRAATAAVDDAAEHGGDERDGEAHAVA